MMRPKSSVPRGYQAVMPSLRVKDAAAAIKFYKKVFGASESYRLKMGGRLAHAEITIGGATVMISDEFPEMKAVGPQTLKGTSVSLTVYVDDADKLVAKAEKAGAKIRRPVADMFYGDRVGLIEDPFGHVWSVHTRIKKIAPKEMQKALTAMMRAEAAQAKARPTKKAKSAAPVKKATARKAPAKAASARKPARKTTRKSA